VPCRNMTSLYYLALHFDKAIHRNYTTSKRMAQDGERYRNYTLDTRVGRELAAMWYGDDWLYI
jgi:hypothetical protein